MDFAPRNLERRLLGDSLSLGVLATLTDCDISDHESVQKALAVMSRFNDRVQAALFGPSRLTPTFSEAEAVKNVRYNDWYGPDRAPQQSAADYRLQLAGQIADKRPWTVERFYVLAQVTQMTRHVCVECWSMIGKSSAAPFSEFLKPVGAGGYHGGIDMPTALHPRTRMAFKLADDILPTRHGYPFKVRIPTKLGFKKPELVMTIYVTNQRPRGFWTDRGYNWFSGI